MKIEKIDIENNVIEYFKFGTGKKNLIIIPGVSISSILPLRKNIAEQFSLFKDEYTIYLFEYSKQLKEDYKASEMANDYIKCFEYLKLEDIYLYGVSLGGIIAQFIMANYSHKIKKSTLISTTSKCSEKTCDLLNKWIDCTNKRNIKELNRLFATYVYSKQTVEALGESIDSMNLEATEIELNNFAIRVNACMLEDTKSILSRIKCPCLLIGSKVDKIFNHDELVYLHNLIDSELISFEGYSHAVYDECSEVLIKTKEFFDR